MLMESRFMARSRSSAISRRGARAVAALAIAVVIGCERPTGPECTPALAVRLGAGGILDTALASGEGFSKRVAVSGCNGEQIEGARISVLIGDTAVVGLASVTASNVSTLIFVTALEAGFTEVTVSTPDYPEAEPARIRLWVVDVN
jgi:hypothetical protein